MFFLCWIWVRVVNISWFKLVLSKFLPVWHPHLNNASKLNVYGQEIMFLTKCKQFLEITVIQYLQRACTKFPSKKHSINYSGKRRRIKDFRYRNTIDIRTIDLSKLFNAKKIHPFSLELFYIPTTISFLLYYNDNKVQIFLCNKWENKKFYHFFCF